MVVQSPFVIVHIVWVGACCVEQLGEPEHVVGVACLWALLAVKHACEVFRRVEMLEHAVSSDAYAPLLDDCVPEELGCFVPLLVALKVGDPLVTDDLRDLCVCMHSGKPVLSAKKRLKQRLVRESLSKLHVSWVAAQLRSICKYLVQAAVLASEHVLHLLVSQS